MRRDGEARLALAFLSPAALLVVAFAFVPLVYAVYLSTIRSQFLFFEPHFVGLANYGRALADLAFWSSLGRGLTFTFWSVALQFVLGMVLAFSLNQRLRLRAIWRAAVFLPWVMSPVVVALLWAWLYYPNPSGLLNYYLQLASAISQPVNWLGFDYAMFSAVLANVWFGTAFSFVIQLAGLQAIPSELLEAATVDGASPWQRLWNVILPLMRPTLAVNLIWITVATFNEFDLIWVLTGGGPVDTTTVPGIYLYKLAFQVGDFGRAGAVAVMMLIANLAASAVYLRLLRTDQT